MQWHAMQWLASKRLQWPAQKAACLQAGLGPNPRVWQKTEPTGWARTQTRGLGLHPHPDPRVWPKPKRPKPKRPEPEPASGGGAGAEARAGGGGGGGATRLRIPRAERRAARGHSLRQHQAAALRLGLGRGAPEGVEAAARGQRRRGVLHEPAVRVGEGLGQRRVPGRVVDERVPPPGGAPGGPAGGAASAGGWASKAAGYRASPRAGGWVSRQAAGNRGAPRLGIVQGKKRHTLASVRGDCGSGWQATPLRFGSDREAKTATGRRWLRAIGLRPTANLRRLGGNKRRAPGGREAKKADVRPIRDRYEADKNVDMRPIKMPI